MGNETELDADCANLDPEVQTAKHAKYANEKGVESKGAFFP